MKTIFILIAIVVVAIVFCIIYIKRKPEATQNDKPPHQKKAENTPNSNNPVEEKPFNPVGDDDKEKYDENIRKSYNIFH